jgi:hypothetical protein
VNVGRRCDHGEVGTLTDSQHADVVASQRTRATRMSRTATAMQNGMLVVYDDPGLQSVARATTTPASIILRASA